MLNFFVSLVVISVTDESEIIVGQALLLISYTTVLASFPQVPGVAGVLGYTFQHYQW
jgi:hypothetical protein